ncbi:PREDICTED: myb/SANT-like DNA-binding domain-containing protein 3 [Vollenhovia emeryi]|uniref:myb/SANT-like DNA-binding domain-containing protein 3 n=1 Tax=Vollenhovia emeryi TaxID=411798 RepID=UPI0005F51E13|nr:PREDICTED: myb/SANT-like DNA-binding domain-containing protein 3 [Vollenhovia emeryi]
MDKNVHYTETERMLLAQLISDEKAIENKKTGAADLKDKAEAWERVTRRYCSQGFPPRTSKQLKKCWDNMKQKKRKLNTSIKVQRLMTGGGVSPAVPVDPVMDFMDATTPNLDIEVPCPFDSTAQFEKEYHIKSNSKRQLIPSDNEDGDSISIADDMENVSSQIVLHTENSKDQYSMCNVKNIAAGGTMKRNQNNQIPASKIEKNFRNLNDEKELRLIKLCEAIEQQRELHSMKMKAADAEVKIALLKLSMAEEKVQMQSESTII